jgi:hypothetical protein
MVRLERIGATEAAARKGCSRQALNYAIRTGKIDAERVGNQNIVVANGRFLEWQPNPKMQKAGKAKARKGQKPK